MRTQKALAISLLAAAPWLSCSQSGPSTPATPAYQGLYEGTWEGQYWAGELSAEWLDPPPIGGPEPHEVVLEIVCKKEVLLRKAGRSTATEMHVDSEGLDHIDTHLASEFAWNEPGGGWRPSYRLHLEPELGANGEQLLVGWLKTSVYYPGATMHSADSLRLVRKVGDPPVPEMLPIAPGSLQMGSTEGRPEELPVHTVTLSQPFWMARHETRQSEYRALMSANPSRFSCSKLPVETVTWSEAMAYCTALTALEAAAARVPAGYEYRLPTEAEWEYCCRAGTTTEFHVGNGLSWYEGNHVGTNLQQTQVGRTLANPWGLSDMHGNVMEWCLDAWDGSANYPAGPVSDPYVTVGNGRICRGGAWDSLAFDCRSASRRGVDPAHGYSTVGFRVVLAPIVVR